MIDTGTVQVRYGRQNLLARRHSLTGVIEKLMIIGTIPASWFRASTSRMFELESDEL